MQTSLIGRAAKAQITHRNPKVVGPYWTAPLGEDYWITSEQDVEIVGAYCSSAGPHFLVLTGQGEIRAVEPDTIKLAPSAHPFR